MEEGEIDESCEKIASNLPTSTYRHLPKTCSSDDESSDEASDNETMWKRRKRSPLTTPNETKPLGTKRNNVWGIVLSEQSLADDIKDFNVKQSIEKTRTVESYDYKTTKKLEQQTTSHPDRKRRKINFTFHYSERETDDEIAAKIAERLNERKVDLIEHTVSEIGRKLGIELLRKTEEIEAGGGMLVNNGSRRRSPGGVYLQLLREHADITKTQIENIFKEDRKMTEVQKKKKKRIKRRLNKEKEKGNADSLPGTDSEVSLPSIVDVVLNESGVSDMTFE